MATPYTTEQLTAIANDYERMKSSHRISQQQYYQRKADERKAYASAYYRANKERILQRLAQIRNALPVPNE